MKKLIVIFMLLPMFCIGQMSKKDSVWIEKGKQELHEMIGLAKGTTLNTTTETTTFITDKTIKEYIDWCYNDSTYVEYWKQPNYSNYRSTAEHGNTMQLSIFIEPTLVKEYKHKEPTFIGFYEWLKSKK